MYRPTHQRTVQIRLTLFFSLFLSFYYSIKFAKVCFCEEIVGLMKLIDFMVTKKTHRKDTNNLQNVGTAASKLLYTLHWTLLDAAEECADADREAGIAPREPFPYIFPLTCIQVCFPSIFLGKTNDVPQFCSLQSSVYPLVFQEFVYLFAPLRHLLKEADLQNFRLENGLKIWPALWDYRHPNAQCFTAPVRPKKSTTTRKKAAAAAAAAAATNSSTAIVTGAHAAATAPTAAAANPPVPLPLPRETVTFNDVFIGKVTDVLHTLLLLPLRLLFQSRTCTF